MKELIFKERFEQATIDFYKNYSILSEKEEKKINPELSESKIGISAFQDNYYPEINNKKALYFDKFYDLKKVGPTITTTKESKIKKYYSNPFVKIQVQIFERSIKTNGDLLTLELCYLSKNRWAQTKFFKKRNNRTIISFNLKTGNFLIVDNQNNQKSFRRNHFIKLRETLRQYFSFYHLYFMTDKNFTDIKNQNDIVFKKLIELLGIEVNHVTDNLHKCLYNAILHFFINKKNIKVPNNFTNILTKYYPTEKFLKRNSRKLILSILDCYKIKSKFSNKLVHKYPDIDIHLLSFLCLLFGEKHTKYMALIDEKIFEMMSNISSDLLSKHIASQTIDEISKLKINESDRGYLLKLFSNIPAIIDNRPNNFNINNFIGMVIDHFKMLETIREFEPDRISTAKNYEDFVEEHNEFSKIVSKIKKGYSIEYQFDSDMVKNIESPIEVISSDNIITIFYPLILKREEEYIEEGQFMHHCVASYASKETSIIISLRKDLESNRITCEFNNTDGTCIQSKHFCNQNPPEEFEPGLDILKKKMKIYAKKKKLKYVDKKLVPYKVNGIEVTKTIQTDLFEELYRLN